MSKKLLEPAIEDLHNEHKDWISDMQFHKDEMKFFEDLLSLNLPKIKTDEQKAQLEHLQNKLIYFKGELIDKFLHDAKVHEFNLEKALESDHYDEDDLYKDHLKYRDDFKALHRDILDYKKELFDFIISLK
tara:strand:+ start:47144 stop:47536 length:393 start_codon:yes stop_codon:yes gene_type:complete